MRRHWLGPRAATHESFCLCLLLCSILAWPGVDWSCPLYMILMEPVSSGRLMKVILHSARHLPLASLDYLLTPLPAFDKPLLCLKIQVFTFQAGRNHKRTQSHNIHVQTITARLIISYLTQKKAAAVLMNCKGCIQINFKKNYFTINCYTWSSRDSSTLIQSLRDSLAPPLLSTRFQVTSD